MAKELVPIIISCAVWGSRLHRKAILFQCDNTGVVAAVNKGTSKEEQVMHLLRALWFFAAHYDITIMIEHIAGSLNQTADHLSRDNIKKFFQLHPQAEQNPTHLPAELLELISETPDWTSQKFTQLFSAITHKA